MKNGVIQSAAQQNVSILTYIEIFNEITIDADNYDNWDISPLLEAPLDIRALTKKQISIFIKYLTDISTKILLHDKNLSESPDINYPKYAKETESYVAYAKKRAKEESPTINKFEEEKADCDDKLVIGEQRVLALLFFIKKIIPQFSKLYENEKNDLRNKALSLIFNHLPNCIILRGTRLISAGILNDEINLEITNTIFKEYLQPYLEYESDERVLIMSPALLGALNVAYKFEVLLGNNTSAHEYSEMFNKTLLKVHAIYQKEKLSQEKTKKKQRQAIPLKEIKTNLKYAEQAMDWTVKHFFGNPWIPLFVNKSKDFKDETQAEPGELIDLDGLLAELLTMISSKSGFDAKIFVERLVLAIKQVENMSSAQVNIQTVASYTYFLSILAVEHRRKSLTGDLHLDLFTSALLFDVKEQFVANMIKKEFQDCANYLNSERSENIPLSPIDFMQSCQHLKNDYMLYSKTQADKRDGLTHIEYIKRLKMLIMSFKGSPYADLSKEVTDAFQGLALTIMTLKIDTSYQDISRLIVEELKKIRALSPNPVKTPVPTRLTTPEIQAGVGDSSTDATPMLTRSPTPEIQAGEGDSSTDATPVLTRSPTPENTEKQSEFLTDGGDRSTVIADNFAPVSLPVIPNSPRPQLNEENAADSYDQLAKQLENIKIADNPNPAPIRDSEIDEQVKTLASQFALTRLNQKRALDLNSQDEVQALSSSLAKKESGLKQQHERKLKAMEDKSKAELDKTKKAMQAQSDEQIHKMQAMHDKSIRKKVKRHDKAKKALEDELKFAQEQAKKKKYQDQQLELAALQETFNKELEELRKQASSTFDEESQNKAHEEALLAQRAAFEEQKMQIGAVLQAQHESRLKSALEQQMMKFKEEFNEHCKNVVDEELSKHMASRKERAHELQKAKLAFSEGARANFAALLNKVDIPLILVPLINQIIATPQQQLALDDYIGRVSKLFYSPLYNENFNVIFNLCFIRNIVPTVPKNYTQIITVNHPDLLNFIRLQFKGINSQEPQHISHTLAVLLLIPIATRMQNDNIDEHIDQCIDEFLACFSAPEAKILVLKKALSSVLKDIERPMDDSRILKTPGLYSKYCQYANNCISSQELATSFARGFNPQYEGLLNSPMPKLEAQQAKLKKVSRPS